MDANPHAVGEEPDDDVFGPVEDGEEVFEWIDEFEAEDDPALAGAPEPAPTLGERLAAMRAAASRLRAARRRIGAVAASLVLAAAVGAACTAWFDGVAGAADRAAVVSLAVDSVVDGDPAAAKYDGGTTSAVAEYVVELANNSPAAVTLDSVGFDAGSLMASTGWRPLGAGKRIPAGGTAKVALTVRMFCPMVVMGVQSGGFGFAGRGGAGAASMPFPALDVRVFDGDGDQRAVTLATRVTVSSLLRGQTGEPTFLGSGVEPTPAIVTAGAGACAPWEAERERQQAQRDLTFATPDLDGVQRSDGMTFAYDKVVEHGQKSFTVAIDVHNTGERVLTLKTRDDAGFLQDPALRTEWRPANQDVGPGETRQIWLTVTVTDCAQVQDTRGSGRADVPAFAEALLEVDDPDSGVSLPVAPEQLMTGSLRLAGDAAREIKAVCP
jgi:hypothetical protein